MEELKIGKYKHFKGEIVEVLYVAHHSETLEDFVVYKTLYENKAFGKGSIWIRPKKMFLESIERDGKVMKRFEFLK